jgi:hypothetical protein
MPFYFSDSNNQNFYSKVNGFNSPFEYLTKTNVVTNNLVFYFDAADRISYPLSGNTWFDLSGNNLNGTILNGVGYSTIDGGALVFDGVNDYVNIPHNSLLMDFSLAQTICMWIKPTTNFQTDRRNPYNQAYGGPGTLTLETNGTINYFFGTNGGNNLPYVGKGSSFTLSANETSFISVSRNQITNTTKWYKNGQLTNTSDAGGYAAVANGTSPILIGAGYVSGFLGNIYTVKVYNRTLSDEEIQQNFDALRQRFGI